MKSKLSCQTTKFRYLIYFTLLLFSSQSYAIITPDDEINCGEIVGFEFTNGHESMGLTDGNSFDINDLPDNFYVSLRVDGYSQSVRYTLENLDTGTKHKILENTLPYTLPGGNKPWNFGNGRYKLTASLFKIDFGFLHCDTKTVFFTFGVEDCTADAGTLQATSSMVTLTGDSVMISATADGNSNIPHGYSSIFVLTSGEDLVIEKVNGTPEFTVTEAGLYTIHTLVYDGREDSANYLNLGVVQFGTTTGGDVLGLVGANGLCAALDVTGAPITVEEDTAKCNAFSGTMYSKNPISCLSNGRAIISAKTNRTPVIPNGYKQLYVLTEAYSLTILKVSEAPKFEVNHAGFYRIHSLVYNPQTLDLSVVVPGQTTGFDVVNLIKSNNICASLDAKGAINLVIGSKWFCYFFNKYFNRGNSSASARGGNDFDMDRFVDNYDSYEAFKKDFIATNSKSKFFPNPVVNTLKVELELFENEVMNYSIIDIRGRNIVSGIARNLEFGLQNIDTRRLTSGMYLVQFVSEYRTITKKIIVKK